MNKLLRIVSLAVVLLLAAACAPATGVTSEDSYVGYAYSGPVKGVAVVMTNPGAGYLGITDTVHMHAVAGLSRHPYARPRFEVLERSALDLVLSEAQFSAGFVDTNSAPQVGELLGADYVLLVAITMADVRPMNVSGVRIAGVRLGASGANVSVGLTARMVDTTTGRVLATGYGELTSTVSTGVSIAGVSAASPASAGMIRDLLPEVVTRSLNDLFRNLDG